MVNENSFKGKPFNRIEAPVVSSKKVDDNVDFIKQQMAKVTASVSNVAASASSLSNDTANEKDVEVGYNLEAPEKARVDKIHENMNNFDKVNNREKYSALFKKYGKVEAFRIELVYKQFEKVVVKKIPGAPTMTFDTPMAMIDELAMPAITDSSMYNHYRDSLLYNQSNHLPFLQSRDDKWWYVKLEKEKKMKKNLPHVMVEVTFKMNIHDLNNKHLKFTRTVSEALEFITTYDDTNNGIAYSKLYVALKTKIFKHRNVGRNFQTSFPANGNGTKFILYLLPPEEDSKPAPALQDDGDSKPAPASQDDGPSRCSDINNSKQPVQDVEEEDSKPPAQFVVANPSSRGYKSQARVNVSNMKNISSFFVKKENVPACAPVPVPVQPASKEVITLSSDEEDSKLPALPVGQPVPATVPARAPVPVPVQPAPKEVITLSSDEEDEDSFADEEDEEDESQYCQSSTDKEEDDDDDDDEYYNDDED